MSRREARNRFDEIVEFAGVERFVDTPVKRYSSGMYLRLAFGVAAHLDADIMIVDEILAVGDAEFQRKCLAKMSDIERSGRTVIFVSHDIDAIARLCPRVLWLDRGRLVQDGRTDQVVTTYLRSALDGSTSGVIEPEPGAPVVVERMRVCDSSGQPTAVLPRNEAFVVEVDFVLEREVSGLYLSAVVDTLSGLRVLDEAWSDADPLLLRRAGTYQLRLTVPPVLNAGDYTVGLWMGTPYDTFVWAESVVTFRLEGSALGRPDRILQLGLPWSTDFRPEESTAL
jgi:ABC-2 type transport system ATP-binding protein/lipopolysaccharide transport system ATP-binding protein